jgi:hypothetical protein
VVVSEDAPIIGNVSTGQSDAPTVPCEACAEASQRAVLAATVVGAIAGVGLFYLFTRYAK